MLERFKLIPGVFAVYSLLYIHVSFMSNINEMQFKVILENRRLCFRKMPLISNAYLPENLLQVILK